MSIEKNRYIQNKHCYDFQLRDFYTPGLFDDFVDMTYIITSHDNLERNKKVELELQKLIPTRKIYFVYNSTYKTCNKILSQQIPPYDLKDANLNIIHHSLENGFNNILILENDFFYSDFLLNNTNKEEIVREIKDFFNDLSISEKPFAYNLGPNIVLCYPNFFSKHNNTHKLITGAGNQAVIYNKKIQFAIINEHKNILTQYITDIDKNIDIYINFNFDVYFYKTPLIIQKWGDTENSNYWSENKPYNAMLKNINKLLGMDTNPELGLSIKYNIAFFINYLFMFLIFVFVCCLSYYFVSRISSTKKIVRNKINTKQNKSIS
jgi:hypothetical protein